MLSKDDIEIIKNLLKPIKDDISSLKADSLSLKADMQVVKSHNLGIEMAIIDLKQTFETNLLKWKSELFTKIDNVMDRLEKTELENTILKAKQSKNAN